MKSLKFIYTYMFFDYVDFVSDQYRGTFKHISPQHTLSNLIKLKF